MPKTEIRSGQILDATVSRDDLNTATTTKAVIAKIIAGTNITIGSTGVDAGTGDVTINSTASGGGLTWAVITGATTAVASNGYIADHAVTRVVVTLPATAAVGAEIVVTNIGAAGWRIAQPVGDSIRLGNVISTTGTGGYLESTALGDTVRLICTVANTGWQAIVSFGNITYV